MLKTVLSSAVLASLVSLVPLPAGPAEAKPRAQRSECETVTSANARRCCKLITRRNIEACTGRPCLRPPELLSVQGPSCGRVRGKGLG